MLLSFVLGGRYAERIALGLMPVGLVIAVAIAVPRLAPGAPLAYVLGGYAPPLGIALAGRWNLGRHAGDGGAGDRRLRILRAGQVRDAVRSS